MGQDNKSSRKSFLKKSALLAALPFIKIGNSSPLEEDDKLAVNFEPGQIPLVISTWKHGVAANVKAIEFMAAGKSSLDAVEAGVRVPESDPEVTSVGYGGFPDRDGFVTLDACIMNSQGDCGSVSFLQHIKNPISVARKVMEDTPYIMLSGQGALDFALSKGFTKENLLTPKAKASWEAWKKKNSKEVIDINNHDTIGMLAIDEDGTISGACTTSGLAWKLHGRVGDSPIIGAGLFVDGEVGGATATGLGESVIKIAGSHLIVELMRQGMHPQKACETAIDRIVKKQKDHKNFQVGFLALNIKGEFGAFSLQKGFQFAMNQIGLSGLYDAGSKY